MLKQVKQAAKWLPSRALDAALEPSYDVIFDFETHAGVVIHAEDALARYRGMLFLASLRKTTYHEHR